MPATSNPRPCKCPGRGWGVAPLCFLGFAPARGGGGAALLVGRAAFCFLGSAWGVVLLLACLALLWGLRCCLLSWPCLGAVPLLASLQVPSQAAMLRGWKHAILAAHRGAKGCDTLQAGYSSVGRASDCRHLQPSDGPWFDSGWPDFCSCLLLCCWRFLSTRPQTEFFSLAPPHQKLLLLLHFVRG